MSVQKRKLSRKSELGIETLEGRSLLSAIHSIASHALPVSSHVSPYVSKIAGSVGQVAKSSETHLTATLASTGADTTNGTVCYESESEHGKTSTSLNVSVKGGTAGAVLTVSIPDATGAPFTLGTIVVAADGTGKLSLSSNPHGTQTSLPANLPTIAATTVVSVSVIDATTQTTSVIASGSLAIPTGKHGDGGGGDHHSGGGHEANESHLGATLTDTASMLAGTAKYESETEHGLIHSHFVVRLKGGTVGTVIDVTIADTAGNKRSVGTITILADGTGSLSLSSNPHGKNQLPLPANFPASLVGSSVILSSVDPVTSALTQITTANLV